MCAKKNFNNTSVFEEKYDLYGDMLYKLGIIYFGPGKDYLCQEAMEEAFLWLLTRKKSSKNSKKEKLELTRHMVLICESKSKRKSNGVPQMEEEMSVDTSFSESMDMLETAYRLPNKYKPVLHLALYEDMNEGHISKTLSIPWPIVKRLLANGLELMEMVMETKLSRENYCRMMNECKMPSDIKEEVYFYLTEGKPHVKTYLSPLQKGAAALAAIAVAALTVAVIRLYPVLKPVISTKYAFMNGTIRTVTLNNIQITNVPGILFAYSDNNYQGYTLYDKSLKQLETKHITKTIDYAGKEFLADFYYCIKDDHLAVFNISSQNDKGFAYIYPQYYGTEKILVLLYGYDMENTENSENGVNTLLYPLIMDINTLNTTDFISLCGIPDVDQILGINLNDSLPCAIIGTKNNDIYYLDIKSSSSIKLASAVNNYLGPIHFYNDKTITYSITSNETSALNNTTSYYEYSINTNAIRKCCEIDSTSKIPFYGDAGAILLRNHDNTCSIMDIRTGASANIPHIQNADELTPQFSPDGRHILFEKDSRYILNEPNHYVDAPVINKIYIYDIDTKKTSILNLSDYKDVYITSSFWYDNSHIAMWKEDFAPDSNNSFDQTGEYKFTLWIFDINKLK